MPGLPQSIDHSRRCQRRHPPRLSVSSMARARLRYHVSADNLLVWMHDAAPVDPV